MNDSTNNWQDAFDAVDASLQQWQTETARPTLTDIEEAVEQQLAKLKQQMVNDIVQDQSNSEPPPCPTCGHKLKRNGNRVRQVRSKDETTITLNRTQWRCPSCQTTVFPPR